MDTAKRMNSADESNIGEMSEEEMLEITREDVLENKEAYIAMGEVGRTDEE